MAVKRTKARRNQIIYRYKGEAYNRPCQRGICVGPNMEPLEEKLPDGDFYIEILVRTSAK
jgi:hypothetical protein